MLLQIEQVNVASRMESNSKAGCVNVSLAAAMLLAQQSPALAEHLVARGEVEVKGKGKMEARPDPRSRVGPNESLILLMPSLE